MLGFGCSLELGALEGCSMPRSTYVILDTRGQESSGLVDWAVFSPATRRSKKCILGSWILVFEVSLVLGAWDLGFGTLA
jgi:hypothetical protein